MASKRAKQLLKGAKPKMKAKSRNLIRIAQAEVRAGLVDFEIIPERLEEAPEIEDRVFVGGDAIPEDSGDHEPGVGKDVVEGETAEENGEAPEETEEESEEEVEDILKEEKDE